MKAPADSFGMSAPRPRSASSNKKGKAKGGIKGLKEQQAREAERKKMMNAEKNLQDWFTEIKANLDKDDDADFNDVLKIKVRVCKEKDQSKRIIQLLFHEAMALTNDQRVDQTYITKEEFAKFLKATKKEPVLIEDLQQMFNLLTKKLGNQNNANAKAAANKAANFLKLKQQANEDLDIDEDTF